MKAKKKKQIISLAVLAVLLAALIIGYLVISKMDFDDGDSTSDYSYVTVVSAKSDDITSVSYTADGAETITFNCENGKWYLSGDADFPVKQSTVQDMASAVSSVTANRELADGDTGEYGFDAPSLTVSAAYSDGVEYTLYVGDKNTFNSNVYLKDQDGKVYMFTDSLSEKFAYGLDDLIQLDDPAADVDINYLVDVTITAEDGSQNVITDSAGMNDSMDSMDKLDCTEWVEYAMDEEEFAAYGIGGSSARYTVNYKSAVAVTDENGNTTTNRVPSTYEFIFGNHFTAQDADGNEAEYVYYTATGSEILYRTPISVFDEIMSWMEYTAPETDEADGTESAADSADTAAVTE